MRPVSFYVREVSGVALLAGVFAIAACSSLTGSSAASSVVTTYAPVTSVEVDANALFERIGCGPLAGQAFKYVVAAYEAGPDGLATKSTPDAVTITDCYTDALFQNLSNSQLFGATPNFSLEVYVFDQPTYNLLDASDGLDAVSVNSFPADGSSAIARDALWTSTCTARQLPNVESLAACDGLHD